MLQELSFEPVANGSGVGWKSGPVTVHFLRISCSMGFCAITKYFQLIW